MLFLFFLRSLLFSNYSSVFYGVLPSYGGAAIVGDVACGDRTLVPDGGEKNQSLLLFFPSMQRHQFLIFLHDCCSVAHRGKKMARGWQWCFFKRQRERLEREWGYSSSLLSLLLSPIFFFVPCLLLSGFKNNLPVLIFFYSSPFSVPFFYFVSLSKLLSTSQKSPLFPFCFTLSLCLSSKSCPPLYFWFSPCIYRKQGEGPPYSIQA